MEYRNIPRAGWQVSRLTLGTVELGMAYGLGASGTAAPPTAREADRLVRTAVEHGVNLFDTAPAYGESERVLGRILSGLDHDKLRVATKIGPFDTAITADAIGHSLERSRRHLRRERLDLVQIHNATAAQLHDSPLMEILVRNREKGAIGAIGASVYGEEAALSATAHPEIATLQIAYNLLDQRMSDKVLPEAARRGVAVMGRSTFLKGVLTARRDFLPDRLNALKALAEHADRWARAHDLDLAEAALRFCLADQALCCVLVGVSSAQELLAALTVTARGPLPPAVQAAATTLAEPDTALIDPRFWGID
jgi:aryl-alcohol dehydrogenase-like predicted oxidoreductase